MNYKKSKRKELRKKHENLVGKRYVEEVSKEPVVSLTEWVDLMRNKKTL